MCYYQKVRIISDFGIRPPLRGRRLRWSEARESVGMSDDDGSIFYRTSESSVSLVEGETHPRHTTRESPFAYNDARLLCCGGPHCATNTLCEVSNRQPTTTPQERLKVRGCERCDERALLLWRRRREGRRESVY